MAASLYQMIFGDSGGMMSSSGGSSLTSVFLAASVVTLALGYLSKVLLQPTASSSGDQVSGNSQVHICITCTVATLSLTLIIIII